eukprot:gene11332-biopygen4845
MGWSPPVPSGDPHRWGNPHGQAWVTRAWRGHGAGVARAYVRRQWIVPMSLSIVVCPARSLGTPVVATGHDLGPTQSLRLGAPGRHKLSSRPQARQKATRTHGSASAGLGGMRPPAGVPVTFMAFTAPVPRCIRLPTMFDGRDRFPPAAQAFGPCGMAGAHNDAGHGVKVATTTTRPVHTTPRIDGTMPAWACLAGTFLETTHALGGLAPGLTSRPTWSADVTSGPAIGNRLIHSTRTLLYAVQYSYSYAAPLQHSRPLSAADCPAPFYASARGLRAQYISIFAD